MNVALITGITGQDGAYLAEFLLEKGYEVHGIKRRSSSFNTARVDHLFYSQYATDGKFVLHHGDMTDASSLLHIMEKVAPTEIYNLAAQSHVAVSFEEPEYTANSDALGSLRLLEAMRTLKLENRQNLSGQHIRIVWIGAGKSADRDHSLLPAQPLCCGQAICLLITVNYREAYDLFACNGILFNHESPIRGETFVTRKITRALARIKLGSQNVLRIGNLNAMRDWGHARDYVEMMWLMLQQKEAEDFVIATGRQYSVRDFINAAADALDMVLEWRGEGIHEVAYWANSSQNHAKLLLLWWLIQPISGRQKLRR